MDAHQGFARRSFLIVLALLCVVTLVGIVVATRFLEKTPEEQAEGDAAALTHKVSQLYELPEDELPTVATVTDPKKLEDQSFFAKAVVGDKFLLFAKAKVAILYRPSIHKLIAVTPYAINEQGQETMPAVPESIHVLIYNGNGIPGSAEKMKITLEELDNSQYVVSTQNASRTTYANTIVYGVSQTHTENVAMIAQLFNATIVNEAPNEQILDDTDIVIVIGNDR